MNTPDFLSRLRQKNAEKNTPGPNCINPVKGGAEFEGGFTQFVQFAPGAKKADFSETPPPAIVSPGDTALAANDGPTFVTPDPDYDRLPWWRVAILADGRRIESDTPSGMRIREWTDYAARHFGPGATVTPLMALHAGPYHVRHADGHTWTMHPTGGLPMSRQAIEAEAQRVTAGVHGEVVAVEEVEQ